MRAVIQRVTEASVSVDGNVVGSIGPGMVVLLGVEKDDSGKRRCLYGGEGIGSQDI